MVSDNASLFGRPEGGQPLFSVVIPAYNAAHFIETTLKSVYAQTCSDFEVVVVNDGSTDATLQILQKQTDARLRVITQENGGECRARNRGIQEAQGKYIAFLDSDDVWLPNHLEIALQFFARRPDVVWYSTRYERVDDIDESVFLETSREENPEFMTVDWFAEGDYWTSASSAIILREALPQIALFPPGVKMFGDCIGWCRMAMQHPRMGVCTSKTILYRQVSSSACRVYTAGLGSVCTLESTGTKAALVAMTDLLKVPGCSPRAKHFIRSYFVPLWSVHAAADMYQGLKKEMDELDWTLNVAYRYLLRFYIKCQILFSASVRYLITRSLRFQSRRMKKVALRLREKC